jgi:hypothetical protein
LHVVMIYDAFGGRHVVLNLGLVWLQSKKTQADKTSNRDPWFNQPYSRR